MGVTSFFIMKATAFKTADITIKIICKIYERRSQLLHLFHACLEFADEFFLIFAVLTQWLVQQGETEAGFVDVLLVCIVVLFVERLASLSISQQTDRQTARAEQACDGAG